LDEDVEGLGERLRLTRAVLEKIFEPTESKWLI